MSQTNEKTKVNARFGKTRKPSIYPIQTKRAIREGKVTHEINNANQDPYGLAQLNDMMQQAG